MGRSAIAAAQSAIERLYDVFVAERLTDTRQIDSDLEVAVLVQRATSQWDAGKKRKTGKRAEVNSEPVRNDLLSPDQVYRLQNINIAIPRGHFVRLSALLVAAKLPYLKP